MINFIQRGAFLFGKSSQRLPGLQSPGLFFQTVFYISGDQGYFLNFNKFLPEKVFGISAAWNPLPHVEALTVDLEGDGQPETIITATNIRDEDIEAIASGKIDEGFKSYSSVILSRNGVSDLLILAEDFESAFDYSVPFVADVDEDGIMEVYIEEIWLGAIPAEGFALTGEQLLKVKGGTIEKMVEMVSSPV